MDRVAILVDAGYLFAQGAVALTGRKHPRSLLILNVRMAIAALRQIATEKTPGLPLLRIYWYDGASYARRPSDEHMRLAHQDELKLRLGFLNSEGEQKGVDSLIVTDLIELARNRAVSDVVLLSGDEDTRIGVVIAQSFGVRIHLLGIAPSRGSQSHQLMQEADTCTEWDSAVVEKMLRLLETAPEGTTRQPHHNEFHEGLDKIAREVAATVSREDLMAVVDYLHVNKNLLPMDCDAKLLARSRDLLGRNLSPAEKYYARSRLREQLKSMK